MDGDAQQLTKVIPETPSNQQSAFRPLNSLLIPNRYKSEDAASLLEES
jgi:hypothetical protein